MAEVLVDIGAVRHNLGRLRAGSGRRSRVMLVAKSDFYGLGLDLAAKLERDVDCFAVNSSTEALRLVKLTKVKPVVVLYPRIERASFAALLAVCLAHRRILPTLLPTPTQVKWLDAAMSKRRGPPLACHVLVPQPGDRFWDESPHRAILEKLLLRKNLSVRGVFTHFAGAGAMGDAGLAARIDRFVREVRKLDTSLPLSVSDSHLAARRQGLGLDFCRVGLYPLGAVPPAAAKAHHLHNVLTLTARVVNSYRLPQAGRVGYCRRQLPRGTNVAILDLGFASGLPFDFFRRCRAVAPGGRDFPFLEKPWMEYACLVTGQTKLALGTVVELFGARRSVYAQAELAGLPVEDLFLHLSRVPRKVVGK